MKIYLLVLFWTVSLSASFAQDTKLSEAFNISYVEENKTNYTSAIYTLKSVYAEDSYPLNLRLGWLHYKAGQHSESVAYYKKAIKLMPYAIEPHLGIVNPISTLGNWDEVLAHYQEILKIDANNSTVNYRSGLIYYYRKDYKNAEPYLKKVTNLYPFDYDAVISLAYTYLYLGNYNEAKQLFNRSLLISPMNQSALDGLKQIK